MENRGKAKRCCEKVVSDPKQCEGKQIGANLEVGVLLYDDHLVRLV